MLRLVRVIALLPTLTLAAAGCASDPPSITVNCSISASQAEGTTIECTGGNVAEPAPAGDSTAGGGSSLVSPCLPGVQVPAGYWVNDKTGEALLPPHATIEADGAIWWFSFAAPVGGFVQSVSFVVLPIDASVAPPEHGADFTLWRYEVDENVFHSWGQGTTDDPGAPNYGATHTLTIDNLHADKGEPTDSYRVMLAAPFAADPKAGLILQSPPILNVVCPD